MFITGKFDMVFACLKYTYFHFILNVSTAFGFDTPGSSAMQT